MSNRFVLPLETPVDATGAPYPGGQLFFYESGTSTKLNTYSNEALTIANTNPVVLDSAGRYPNAIFLQNKAYSVILTPADDTDPPTSPIWSQDPVYASDYSTAAQFASGSGSPNGVVAGTAGSATILASSYWDYTNDILYICTTTGTASTAAWTAINASSSSALITPPQGYLTPTSGTAVITNDVTAGTAIYYTPYKGVYVPIYNGASFVPLSIISELSLTLTSSHAANNIYDCYVFLLNGVVTLGTGPSWSAGSGGSITAGSCARGTGAGGAALSLVQGIWTNTASMIMRYGNGTTTTTVNANLGTYVGTMLVSGTNGQINCFRSWGQSREWAIWNCYNRQPIVLQCGDSTSSWSYGTSTWRASDGSSNNSINLVTGLPEEFVSATFCQKIQSSAGGTPSEPTIGVGWNSTTAPSGTNGEIYSSSSNGLASVGTVSAYYSTQPLGRTIIYSLENTLAGTFASSFFGTQPHMNLTVQLNG